MELGSATTQSLIEDLSGDRPVASGRDAALAFVLRPREGGALVALVSPAGPRHLAGHLASIAAAFVETAPPWATPRDVVERCHTALTGTSGVSLLVARVDARPQAGRSGGAMTWCGVGQVAGFVRHEDHDACVRHRLEAAAGLAGVHLPPVDDHVVPIAAGDLVSFVSLGAGDSWRDALVVRVEPNGVSTHVVDARGLRAVDGSRAGRVE